MPRTRDSRRVCEARRLYLDEGLSAARTGELVGVDERTVRRWLAGELRPRGPRPAPKRADLAALAAERARLVARIAEIDAMTGSQE
jgi:hypothetical protein